MFKKFGSLVKIEQLSNDTIHKLANQVKKSFDIFAGDLDTDNFSYFRARAVSAGEYHGPNGNGDWFPEEQLMKHYATFRGKGVYLNHQSDDISNAVGVVLDAVWHEAPEDVKAYIKTNKILKEGMMCDGAYVECLFAVDKKNHPKVAEQFENGIINDVSMGASISTCFCNICAKECHSEEDYCDHLTHYLGRELKGKRAMPVNDGGRVVSINRGINFYDLSGVNVGADKEAKILERLASMEDPTLVSQYSFLVKAYNKLVTAKGEDMADKKKGGVRGKIAGIVKKKADDMGDMSMEHPKEPVDPKTENIGEETLEAIEPENEFGEAINSKLPMELGEGYSVDKSEHDGLVQLLDRGVPVEPKLYTDELASESTVEQVADYRKAFNLDEEIEEEVAEEATENIEEGISGVEEATEELLGDIQTNQTEKSNEGDKNIMSKETLSIKYVEGSDLKSSYFVATKGNMEMKVSAEEVLPEDLKKHIVATEGEAEPGKVVDKVKETTEIIKEKTDNVLNGTGEAEPGKVVDKVQEKTDTSNQEKTDNVLASLEPKDFIADFEKKAGNNMLNLQKIWKGSKLGTVQKKAKIAGTGNFAIEETAKKEKKMTDTTDMNAIEKTEPAGKAGGSKGSEIKSYFGGLDSATLSEPGYTNAIEQVKTVKAALAQSEDMRKRAEAKARILEAKLEKIAEDTEKARRTELIGGIVEIHSEAGLLNVDENEILTIAEEKSVSLNDARAIGQKRKAEKLIEEYASMEIEALAKVAKDLKAFANSTSTLVKKASMQAKATPVMPVMLRNDEQIETADEKLKNMFM